MKMGEPPYNLSTSAVLSLKAADAALKILHEKISQMRKPLVFDNENKLFNNQFKNLAKLELAELEHISSSIEAITKAKKKIIEAELICLESESLMEKAITDAFCTFEECEKHINEMHGKVKASDYNFLADAVSSKHNMKEHEITFNESINEIPSKCGAVNSRADEESDSCKLDESVAAMGITNPAFKIDLRPPVYTSSFAREIMERREIERRIQQPTSTAKPLSENRWDLAASYSTVKPTPLCSKYSRMSVIASGGSSLNGSPFFDDQRHDKGGSDKFVDMPFRDRLLEQSYIVQPQFDESDSALFDTGANLELAFIEESPSGSEGMKENTNASKPLPNLPASVHQPFIKTRPSLHTPLVQRQSDFFARSFRPSLAIKPADDSRLPRPSLAFELKRPVYTSSIGKQFNK